MAFTQAQYDSLQEAYAKGVLEVEYGDQKVTYRSRKEMLAILKEMGEEIGVKTKWNGRTKVKFNNGL